MGASPGLKTAASSAVGLVTIANVYDISGPLGVSPTSQIPVNGSDPAFQQPASGTVRANRFPGRVVAVGPVPADLSGNTPLVDSVYVRQHGAGTVTLPITPWDGMAVVVLDADGTADASPVIVSSSGGPGKIQDPYNFGAISSTSATIRIPYESITYVWDATATLWRVANDTHAGELPLGFQLFTSGTYQLTGKCWAQCAPSGAITLKLPTSPTNGMRVRVSDVSAGAAAHNITVDPGAGKTIDNLVLGGGANTTAISTNNQSATWAYRAAGTTWNLIGIN